MNRLSKACLATVLVASASAPAYAVSWGTIQSSLGYAYGNYFDYGYVSARNDAKMEKRDSNSYGIYVSTYSDFYTSQGGAFVDSDHKTTARTTSRSYVSGQTNSQLLSSAHYVIAQINVCEDRPNQPDPCSDAYASPRFTY